jgi:uncharacterized protein YlxP (DUF503 family)
MIVAIARAELHLPASRSLKEKRQVIKSLVDRCHHRLRVSIAETAHQNLRQRAEIGVALVHGSRSQALRILEQIHRMFDEQPEAQLLNWDEECLEDFDE